MRATTYFPAVDALRGFAALSVVAYHLVALAALPIPTWYPLAWFRVGSFGVDLFFGISGAVILMSLQTLAGRDGKSWRLDFALRRVARIMPLYLLTGAVFILLLKPEMPTQSDWWMQVFTHLLFIHNFWPDTHGSIDGVNWTLAVEIQFYATALLLGVFLLRCSTWRIALIALALGSLWRVGCWFFLVYPHPSRPELMFHATTQLPGLAEEFAAGMIAARWRMAVADERRQPSVCTVVLLGVGALAGWAAALCWTSEMGAAFWTGPLALLSIRPLIALAVGLTVAWALAVPKRRFEGVIVKGLGDWSYGIYLWHLIALLALQRWTDLGSPWVFAVLVLGLTLSLSWLGFKLLERPIMRWARRRMA